MDKIYESLDDRVGVFFLVRGKLLLHTCSLAEAEPFVS